MKIGIDISQSVYKGTGVGRYTHSLIKGLTEYGDAHEYVLFFSSLRQKVPSEILDLIKNKKNFTLKTFRFPPSVLNILWNKLHILPIENLIGNVDIYYTSDWVEPPTKKAKKVATIHDFALFKYPQASVGKTTFDLKNMRLAQNIIETHKQRLKWVKKESSVVLCSSETTKKDAIELLHFPEDKLEVLYLGVEIGEPSKEDLERIKTRYSITNPYILTVGTVQPRKNIQRLITAFTNVHMPDTDLFIIGMKGWGEEVKNTNPHVKLLGFLPDEDLPALYKSSLFFVFPSLYEGFGIPVVEAMKMGKAVATSNTSSTYEITNKFGLTFDPLSEDQICQSIHKLYDDKKLRESLEKKSLKRAEDFTLETFTKGFLKIIETLQ
jgi:glycosyltransferase involved in cell wall biosynthesis